MVNGETRIAAQLNLRRDGINAHQLVTARAGIPRNRAGANPIEPDTDLGGVGIRIIVTGGKHVVQDREISGFAHDDRDAVGIHEIVAGDPEVVELDNITFPALLSIHAQCVRPDGATADQPTSGEIVVFDDHI